jgi:cyclomaltodextrinase
MDDFIFGTLATNELRLRRELARRSGVTHLQARTPRQPRAGQPVSLQLSVGPAHLCEQAWVYWTADGSDPDGAGGAARNGQVTAMRQTNGEWDSLLWGYQRRYMAELPGLPDGTLVRYRIGAADRAGQETFADEGAFYSFLVEGTPAPAWSRSAVVYQIMVDRFSPGGGQPWLQPENLGGFFGGRLKGVTERLEYLAGLGVTALWLCPIFPSPTAHGYDATDYFEIEPRLGSKADLAELLDQAHRRGIRVLLDLVVNHWSDQHPTFQAARRDPASPNREWYHFSGWPDQYEHFFDAWEMPKVNLRHAPARQYLLDAAAYWLKFGVDGFRLDYAIGPAPDFWPEFRQVTRAAKADCWTFGEVVDPPDTQLQFSGGLDGCLDFMLLEALRETFLFGRWSGAHFADFLDRHERFFPADFSRPSFLDNHDMNRFVWAARGDQRRLRLAALCQFSLSAPPIIYYGSEVGLSQQHGVHDPGCSLEESRLPMPWGAEQDGDLLAFYQGLSALRRRAHLEDRTRQWLQAGADRLVYKLACAEPGAGEDVIVALNLADRPTSVEIAGNWSELLLATGLDNSLVLHQEVTKIDLAPLGGVLVQLKAAEPSG